MNKIKKRELTSVKRGLVFPAMGTMWKVANYDYNDHLWVCQNYFDHNDYTYFSEEKIREIFGIPRLSCD